MRLTQLLNGARLDCFPTFSSNFILHMFELKPFFVCGKLNRNKIHPFHLHPARKMLMRLICVTLVAIYRKKRFMDLVKILIIIFICCLAQEHFQVYLIFALYFI